MSNQTSVLYKLACALLVGFATAADVGPTCNLWQTCASNEGVLPTDKIVRFGSCADPSAVTEPVFIPGGYEPTPMAFAGQSAMDTACPMIDYTQPLCCNQDNAQIMSFNYAQLDAVFNYDCPICASNLKRMWCEYACYPTKAEFMADGGEREATAPLTGMWRNVNVFIDASYACGIFTSCAKESYIAQSGIQSAVAFLDFMGSNGAPFSLSWITFTLVNDVDATPSLLGEENLDYFACEYQVPMDGVVLGYEGNTNTTCSYCDAACTPPVVDDKIAFLDGLSWKIVGWSYLSFVLFTIVFQLVIHFCCQAKQIENIKSEIEAFNSGASHASARRGQGKPLNMTDEPSQDSGRPEDR